ncbi:MAG: hypothetical protein R3357_00720, partial [Burkholderiales bacterium]|nr:hypothetical protein [Burkholderiales bacterium]
GAGLWGGYRGGVWVVGGFLCDTHPKPETNLRSISLAAWRGQSCLLMLQGGQKAAALQHQEIDIR